MLKAIVIDDELYAREELNELLVETEQVQVIEQCSNAIEGLKAINSLKPDVVFLDIHMPQITGLDLLSMLDPDTMPKVVFVTAYDEYAVKAFEDNAFDYLLKPVESGRLLKTLKRVNAEKLEQPNYEPITANKLELIPCSGFNRILLLAPNEIEIAMSEQTGVHLLTDKDKFTASLSLKVLEEKTDLIRCHRQYLINPTCIREIKLLDNGSADIVTKSNHHAPVSRRYLKVIKDRFGLM
ncbi:two-component system response regulator BtsR [Psychromonas sp. 14N.309.X.WAT.B.A12]|uniref:two-component system response regulator BtsR n=1 Tax=unclassified Psychromonas TaxID=2614957 RepID=UPI0025B09ADF|nr:two-component system response regulator BtsR [Psychromonas sp. 14N.309.X.WAT.B.A12]MDN2661864.1 two-component system response regulator BtsR [Psychromonas sp. 14N.309.X.WAT.B.A12]